MFAPLLWVRPAPAPRAASVLPPPADSFVPRTLTPFEAAKAQTLLETRLPCLGCHTIDGRGGRIGPALDGVGSRLDARLIWRRLLDPRSVLPGTLMPKTPMDDATRSLLANYLSGKRVGGAAPPVTPAPTPASASRVADTASAATLYAAHCAACHGDRGHGDGFNAPYLPVAPTAHASAVVMGAVTDDALFDVIAGGGRVLGKSPFMPAWGDMLSPAQIRLLVTYVRGLCQCEGPAWSRGGR
jgi:mono/diheme cytochrome c family protein